MNDDTCTPASTYQAGAIWVGCWVGGTLLEEYLLLVDYKDSNFFVEEDWHSSTFLLVSTFIVLF